MTADPISGEPQPAAGGPPPNPLASVSRHERDGVPVACVRGEIDVSNAEQLGAELSEVSNQALGLVLDLRDVKYLDTTGIALLYNLHLRLERREQKLVVIAPAPGAPRRVLELTGFDTRVALADEADTALAAIRR